MATATTRQPDPVIALTEANRQAQARQAALTAALVVYYYRTRVNVEDPNSIAAWLDIVVPRILADRGKSSQLAAIYADAVRRLELPKATDGFKFPTAASLDPNAIRASLSVVGPRAVQAKLDAAKAMEDRVDRLTHPQVKASNKQALIADANRKAEVAIGGAVARHVQNGGRQIILDGVRSDKKALGYVRVTDGDPCFFCAMLASRGLVFADDSFDESNARFTGAGTVKVHDSCGCGLKPSYRRDDPLLEQSRRFREMWDSMEHRGGKADLLQFRQIYEGRSSASSTQDGS